MAHTPGPWIAQKDDRSTNQPYSIYSELFSTKCDGKFVDDPVALYVEPQNKDLIAAAPDLLEAAEDTIFHLFNSRDCGHGEGFTYNFCPIVALRAAIAKAKGEQS